MSFRKSLTINFVLAILSMTGFFVFAGNAQAAPLSGTNADLDQYVWFDGTTYTDQTSAANNGTTDDVTLGSAVTTNSPAAYFGMYYKFNQLSFDISTLGTDGEVTWEYWNGAAWTAATVTDNTSNFTAEGTVSIAPALDWATKDPDGGGSVTNTLYWIRARVTTGYTIVPLGTQISAREFNLKVKVKRESDAYHANQTVVPELVPQNFTISGCGDTTVYAFRNVGNGTYELGLLPGQTCDYTVVEPGMEASASASTGALSTTLTDRTASPDIVQYPADPDQWVKITKGGGATTLGLKADGSVWAWGHDSFGQIGDGGGPPYPGDNSLNTVVPVRVLGLDGEGFLSDIVDITEGGETSFALKSDGTLYGWGLRGIVGDGTDSPNRNAPVRVVGPGGVGFLSDVVAISMGGGNQHVLALKSDGTVWAWGVNFLGQLGNGVSGYPNKSLVPIQVHGVGDSGFLTDVVSVAGGGEFSLAIKSDGTVYSWGWNSVGQLGDGTIDNKNIPVQMLGPGGNGYFMDVIRVTAGGQQSLAIKSDGTVWAWGNNGSGALGIGTEDAYKTSPTQVVGSGGIGYLSDVIDIRTGNLISTALKSDGTVWAWGSNTYGEAGIGEIGTSYLFPVQVHGLGDVGFLSNVIMLGGTNEANLALKSDGTIDGWGQNGLGQLGDMTEVNRSYPVLGVILPNLQIKVIREGDDQLIAGLTSDKFTFSDCGDTNIYYAYEPENGIYQFTLTSGQTCNYTVSNDGYITTSPVSTGALTTTLTDRTATPDVLQFGLKVVVADETGGALTPDTATFRGVSYATNSANTYYFADTTGVGGSLSVQKPGYFIAAETTNTGLSDITTNSSTQTVITMGDYPAVSDPIVASANIKGMIAFNLRIKVIREGDDQPIAGLTSDKFTFSDCGDTNIYSMYEMGSGVYHFILTSGQTCNYTVSNDGYITTSPVSTGALTTTLTDRTATPDVLQFGLKVVVADETGGALTPDTATFRGVSYATNSANTYYFADTTGVGGSLSVQKPGYFIAAETTNTGLSDITTNSSTQVVITMGNYPAVSDPITVDTNVRGMIAFNLQIKVIREMDDQLISGLASDKFTFSDCGDTNIYEFQEVDTGIYQLALTSGQTCNYTVSNDGYVTTSPTSTGALTTTLTDRTATPDVLQFGNKVIVEDLSQNPIIGATVTAGDGYGVSCIDGGDGSYYCPVPLSNTELYALAGKDGYDSSTNIFSADRTVDSDPTQTTTIILAHNLQVKVIREGDNQPLTGLRINNLSITNCADTSVKGFYEVGNGLYKFLLASGQTCDYAVVNVDGYVNMDPVSTGLLSDDLTDRSGTPDILKAGLKVVIADELGNGFDFNFSALSGGSSYSLFLKSDGTVWASGENGSGQFGNGTNDNSDIPVQVRGLSGVEKISAGENHSLALKSGGTVWAWGNNYSGQLGNNTNDDSNTPVQVSGLSGVGAITGGYEHSLALKSDGTVWAWGDNSYGQLGNGTNDNSNVSVQVSSLTNVISVGASFYYSEGVSWALKSDGTVWAWGNNDYGQLGDGTNDSSNVPVQVFGLGDVIAISEKGGAHILALKSDGTVWAWGLNNSGQLGNGTNDNSNVPVQVSGLSEIEAIAGGGSHSLAVKSDGTVWAWGNNSRGQLGNNTNDDSNVPVQVSGLSGVEAAAGGGRHSLTLKSDGTIWAWGNNNSGQLGNGNENNTSFPAGSTDIDLSFRSNAPYAMVWSGDIPIFYWADTSGSASLSIQKTGYVAAETTNAGLNDITTSSLGQIVLTMGAYNSVSSPISASTNIKGLVLVSSGSNNVNNDLPAPEIEKISDETENSLKLHIQTDDAYADTRLDFKVKVENLVTGEEDTVTFNGKKTDGDGDITLTINDLDPGTKYRFKVKYSLHNEDDYSDWSDSKKGSTLGASSQTGIYETTGDIIDSGDNVLDGIKDNISQNQEQLEKFKNSLATSEEERNRNEKILAAIRRFIAPLQGLVGQLAMEAIAVAGLVGIAFIMAPSAASVVSTTSFGSLFRMSGLALEGAAGIKKKRKKWGVVYDSKTKASLPFAVVMIFSRDGRLLDKTLTDKKGRFGFLAKAGTYYIDVKRDDFAFPAKNIDKDDPYENIYAGGTFDVAQDQVIKLNIPMDGRGGIDLREISRQRIEKMFSLKGKMINFLIKALFYFGLILTIIAQFFTPSTLNAVLLAAYAIVIIYQLFFQRHDFGRLIDGKTEKPIPFAIINIFNNNDIQKKLKFIVTDQIGRYYELIENGEYLLKIKGETLDKRIVDAEAALKINDGVLNDDIVC